MDWEKFKRQLEQADNDALLRALVEQAKMMDSNIDSYEAVKIIKMELLTRLDGEPVTEKDWLMGLTAEQEQAVLDQYQQGTDISIIQKGLGDNIAQKAVRLAVAKVYGTQMACERCGITTHIAHKIGEQLFCIECGSIKK